MRKRFAIATKNLALEEIRSPATDQNEIGNATNKEKKATNPKRTTGSKEKLFKRKSTIDKRTEEYSEGSDHLLACFNKKPPPNIDRKTGDQAAKKGFITPFTPRALKLKLKT